MRSDGNHVRGGFTLVELIVAITLSSMIMISMAGLFQSAMGAVTTSADRSDLEAAGSLVLETVRGHLEKAVRAPALPSLPLLQIRPFANIPPGWSVPTEGWGALHFFADLDGDGGLEWVWIWVDPVGAADPRGDSAPRPPFLKVAAFQRYPTNPQAWADYSGAFYALINQDPRRYLILAANLTPQRMEIVNGTVLAMRQGFSVNIPPPGSPGDDVARVTFSSWIDRDGNGLSSLLEPVHFVQTRVRLHTHRRPRPVLPDPRFASNVMTVVRDSALSSTGDLGIHLLRGG